jgi:hypothetical protein
MPSNPRILALSLILLLSALISACGPGSVQLSGSLPEPNGTLTGTGAVYSATLYPLVVQRCSACHGSAQAPFLAITGDPLTSYNNTLNGNYINKTQPELSKMYTKVLSNHNCWSGNCASDANEILAQIKTWVVQEFPSDNSLSLPSILTAELSIPETVTGVNGNVLTFSLAGLGAGLPSDVSLQIRVKRFDDQTYELANLKIKSSVSLLLRNVSAIMNGKEVPSDTFYETSDFSSTPFLGNNQYNPVSGASVFVPIGINSGGGIGSDKLRFGFEMLSSASPAQIRFTNFLSVMQSCTGGACHSNGKTYGNTPAFADFTNESQFMNIMTTGGYFLIKPKDSLNSLIYRYVATGTTSAGGSNLIGGANAMPKGQNATQRNAAATTIKTWIDGLP